MFKLKIILKTLFIKYKFGRMQDKLCLMKQNLKDIRRKGIC